MSTIGSQTNSLSGATALQFPKSAITKLSSEQAAPRMARLKEVLEGAYTRPMADTPGDYGTYAEVTVKGKVVASVANTGAATIMSNELGASIGGQLEMQGYGPTLAQRRAEQIAKAVGGTVVKNKSALTEAQWATRSPIKTFVDYDAMAADPLFDVWKKMSASSQFTTQLLGQKVDT